MQHLYVLTDGEYYYVGSSENIGQRLKAHLRKESRFAQKAAGDLKLVRLFEWTGKNRLLRQAEASLAGYFRKLTWRRVRSDPPKLRPQCKKKFKRGQYMSYIVEVTPTHQLALPYHREVIRTGKLPDAKAPTSLSPECP